MAPLLVQFVVGGRVAESASTSTSVHSAPTALAAGLRSAFRLRSHSAVRAPAPRPRAYFGLGGHMHIFSSVHILAHSRAQPAL